MAPADWRQSKSTNVSDNDSRLDWHCARRIGNHVIGTQLCRLIVKSVRFGNLAVKFPFLNERSFLYYFILLEQSENFNVKTVGNTNIKTRRHL